MPSRPGELPATTFGRDDIHVLHRSNAFTRTMSNKQVGRLEWSN